VPVELDTLTVDLTRRIQLPHAIDAHAAGAHDRRRAAARGEATVGEKLGEAHRCNHRSVDRALLQQTLVRHREPPYRGRQVWRGWRAAPDATRR